MAPKKRTKKKNLKQVAFTRFMLIIAIFILWIGGISVRLVHLQVTQHDWLKEQAVGNQHTTRKTKTFRGNIYDRNERMLATSLRVKTLYANPSEIEDPKDAATALAKILKLNGPQLEKELTEAKDAGRQYLQIAKRLEDDDVQAVNKGMDRAAVKKADMPYYAGLHWDEDQKRSYPYGSLAAQVIGFSNADDEGRAGIEQSQDENLRGAIIRKYQERDRLGRVYNESIEDDRDPPSDVMLTLDAGLQYVVDEELEKGVRAAQAKSGIAIALDPRTGDILAMSNYPTFDPNALKSARADDIGNRAVQAAYSPGSVFKIVTYGSALEKKLISPGGMIDSGNGTIEVAKHTFRDSHQVGRVTYAEALAHSSNVCAIKTGLSVGRDDFYSMVQKMGFGSKTGVELPAESPGIVRSPEKWNGDSLASMSIGYEINVTALQMASAFATIANNGVRVQPHVIKEIRRSDEEPKVVPQPSQTQVISAESAASLRTMLRQVVVAGTGRRAQVNGYSVAGKTGTAWKVNPKTHKVDPSKYMSSFIGMIPADDPRIVIAVVMDEPKVGARDGGMVSAPVFREIAERILPELKIAPDMPVKQGELVAKEIPVEMPGESADIGKIEPVDKPEAKNDEKRPKEDKAPAAADKKKEPTPSKPKKAEPPDRRAADRTARDQLEKRRINKVET